MEKLSNFTSVEIDQEGTLKAYTNGILSISFSGKYWKCAITNGNSIYAVGSNGTIVEIDLFQQINYFDKKVKNAVRLEWFDNSVYVIKDDQTTDVFTNNSYNNTIYPPTPTPTPSQTPDPTPTATATPTPTPTPTITVTPSEIYEDLSPEPTPSVTIDAENKSPTVQLTVEKNSTLHKISKLFGFN